jgi:HK97 family phage major capsid protein
VSADACTGELTDFQIKAADDDPEHWTITGWASTPRVDRQGDRIDPAGVTFANPVKLLLFHDKTLPVGNVTFGPPTAAGVPFTATLPKNLPPGTVRERVLLAWHSITGGLLSKVSAGYRALADSVRANAHGGRDFLQTEFLELSLVTVEANPDAVITRFKSLDTAVSGLIPSAVADLSTGSRPMAQTIQEQITHWTGERGPLVTRMTELMQADRTMSDVEQKSYDDLAGKVSAIDGQIGRLRELEKVNIAAATPIAPSVPTHTKALVQPIRVTPTVPPGTAFVRAVCAKIICHGNVLEAAQYAERWKDSTPEVALYLKAAIAPGTTADATWAKPLVPTNIADEFVALLRPATAIGRIPGMRKVPFNTSVPAQTAGGTYGWVGEGKPKPVTKLAFSSTVLPAHKAAGIIVLTEELARLSSPAAEDVARADMIAGIAAFVDSQFLDPASAAVANVKPASVTNGVTPIASVGPLSDLVAIAGAFSAAGIPIAGITYVMSPSNALVLSFQRDNNGNLRFPQMTAEGGTVNGLSVVTSGAAANNVIGIIPQLVLYGDDGGVTVDVSREASLQMSDAPMDPADATTVYVSLWQNNLVGLRAEWFVSWLKANANAVKYVNNAGYTIPAPTGLEAREAEGGNGGKRSKADKDAA